VRPHAVDPGTLGDYVALWRRAGRDEAAATFPAVATHLAAGCTDCSSMAAEIWAVLDRDEP
jgi:hypothetical protein